MGAAVVLSGVFAGLAASSTHPRKIIRRYRVTPSASQKVVQPALPPPRAPSLSGTATPPAAPPPAPPPAAPAPAPVTSAPVVVSGGS